MNESEVREVLCLSESLAALRATVSAVVLNRMADSFVTCEQREILLTAARVAVAAGLLVADALAGINLTDFPLLP